MITGALKSKIDKLWEEFWTGGITNPLTVIEQISFLMFARLLDIRETRSEKKHSRLSPGAAFQGENFPPGQPQLRWSHLRHEGDAAEQLRIVRDELFPFMRSLGGQSETAGALMRDAQLMIQKPSLLSSAISLIDELPLTEGDTKGDLYEYLLSKLTTAGINGQFRTPRHIIRKMVEMLDPQPNETVADPACGTAGFLVSGMQYLLEKHSSPDGIVEHQVNGDADLTYMGDLLTDTQRQHIQSGMFHGFDFDATMLRIASMNMMLHDVADPDINYQDTLSTSFPDRFPGSCENAFDVILANPPFKGSLDYDDVHPALTGVVKTKKTELLFIALILRMLKDPGGRAATVVPDGVLFGSSKAHKAIRQILVDDNQLDGVISLPSGAFKPYAGVSTAILLFTRGGKTDNVFFYDVQADGFSLDDKRDPIEANDLPDMLAQWSARDPKKDLDRKAKAFCVPIHEIRENGYDLSINRYKEHVYEDVEHAPPTEIVRRLERLQREIDEELDSLESMLR